MWFWYESYSRLSKGAPLEPSEFIGCLQGVAGVVIGTRGGDDVHLLLESLKKDKSWMED